MLVVVNSPDLAVTTQSCTSPGALTARAERLSTGGTDTSIAHASAEKAAAGATGRLHLGADQRGLGLVGLCDLARADAGHRRYRRRRVHGRHAPRRLRSGAEPHVGPRHAAEALSVGGGVAHGDRWRARPDGRDGDARGHRTTRLRRPFFVGEQDAGRLRAGRALVYGLAVAAAIVPVSLDATGGALTLTGGTATLDRDGPRLAHRHGRQPGPDRRDRDADDDARTSSLPATGGTLTLEGGVATLTATQHVILDATGGTLVLTGGGATLDTAGNVALAGTGGTLTLTGAAAPLDQGLTAGGGALC